MTDDVYELFAVRYGELVRPWRDNFLQAEGDLGDAPMHYYIWVAVSEQRTVVVDTGFSAKEAARRGRTLLKPINVGLAELGVDAGMVTDVILTHLHYDHAGGTQLFPHAQFHLQDTEMQFVTGRAMRHRAFAHHFALDDVTAVLGLVYDDRVRFHDGDAPIVPGISVHHVGGHTPGTQGVLVNTARGAVFLASDAAHFYANYHSRNAFPVLHSHAELLDGYDRITALVPTVDHVIPGHDPRVLDLYPAPSPELQGWVGQLHQPPIVPA